MHENTLLTLFVEGVNWAITSEFDWGSRRVGLKYQSINEYGVLWMEQLIHKRQHQI